MARDYLTVSQLTKYVARKFDADPYLETVYLTGEISNISRNNPNGHQYFTLKDEDAQISVVMFKRDFQKVRFQPKDGDKVLVIGRVTVYQPRGNYQMIIDHMEPDGIGQLYKLYEETKNKLALEGLFSLPKQPLPRYPKRIGVITSSSGAVIHDIILNVRNRFPIVQVVLYPTVVQGNEAAASIVQNIQRADQQGDFDVLIVGRGGGSFEDLFAFNEEAVVRAIVSASTPIISSVGHETDTSLADLAADYRASTPTEAAVVATPVLKDELLHIQRQQNRLLQAFKHLLRQSTKQLENIRTSYIVRQPQRLYEEHSQSLDLLNQRLQYVMTNLTESKEQRLKVQEIQLSHHHPQKQLDESKEDAGRLTEDLHDAFTRYFKDKQTQTEHAITNLDMLSPLKILGRGYTYTKKDDAYIKSVSELQPDDQINIRFEDGSIDATITNVHPDEETERK